MRHQQDIARKEGIPLFLEATTRHSRDIYLHQGFRVTGEFWLGKGRANGAGDSEKGGPGVQIWSMIWEPEQHLDSAS
jgi:hypothetical protein